MRICIGIVLIFLLAAGGCVERTLSVKSNPSGALVYLNDQEVGRTPMTIDFKWYGYYELTLRKDGYDSLKTTANVIAPVYEWMPFDLASELIPFKIKDHHDLQYDLHPEQMEPGDFRDILDHAEQAKSELQSSEYTISRPTRATTQLK